MNTRRPDFVYPPRGMSGLHPVGEPQETEWADMLPPGTQSVLDEIERLADAGKLKEYLPKSEALPVFVLGLVGGAIGARVLKGAFGLVIAGGVGYWAWQRLGNK